MNVAVDVFGQTAGISSIGVSSCCCGCGVVGVGSVHPAVASRNTPANIPTTYRITPTRSLSLGYPGQDDLSDDMLVLGFLEPDGGTAGEPRNRFLGFVLIGHLQSEKGNLILSWCQRRRHAAECVMVSFHVQLSLTSDTCDSPTNQSGEGATMDMSDSSGKFTVGSRK